MGISDSVETAGLEAGQGAHAAGLEAKQGLENASVNLGNQHIEAMKIAASQITNSETAQRATETINEASKMMKEGKLAIKKGLSYALIAATVVGTGATLGAVFQILYSALTIQLISEALPEKCWNVVQAGVMGFSVGVFVLLAGGILKAIFDKLRPLPLGRSRC